MQGMNLRAFAAASSADMGQTQREHWEKQLAVRPNMFGAEASAPAHYLRALLEECGGAGSAAAESPRLRDLGDLGDLGDSPEPHESLTPLEGRACPKPPNPPEVLELGAGQGRDTLYFAAAGMQVLALDYAEAGVRAVEAAAHAAGFAPPAGSEAHAATRIRVLQHDVRQPLPLADASVDACYAHMLLCMALRMAELRALCAEVRRVLRPGGVVVYTVRHEGDPHYGAGTHGGENMYETGGFMVHFFNSAMVDSLAQGFALRGVHAFEEGALPRRLWRVTMQKAQ